MLASIIAYNSTTVLQILIFGDNSSMTLQLSPTHSVYMIVSY